MLKRSFQVAKALFTPLVFATVLFVATFTTLRTLSIYESSSLADLFYSLYGGLEWDFILHPSTIATWVIVMLPALLGLTDYFQLALGNHFSLAFYRYKSPYHWWAAQTLGLVFFVVLILATYAFTTLIIGLANGLRGFTLLASDSEGFIVAHSSLWLIALLGMGLQMLQYTLLFANLFLLFRDYRLAIIGYISPIVIGLLKYSNDEIEDSVYGFINWGMVKRYTYFSSYGVNPLEGMKKILLSILVLALVGILLVNIAKPAARTNR